MTDRKPYAREIVLLWIGHWIMQRGHQPRTADPLPETDYESVVVTLSSWHIQTKASIWGAQQYGKNHNGATLSRRWREIRQEHIGRLSAVGIDVHERPPTEDEAAKNRVWDLHVDVPTFLHQLREVEPWTQFKF